MMVRMPNIPTQFNTPNISFLSKYQVHLPEAISAMASLAAGPVGLPDAFTVGPDDVVCGRGKGSYNRPGNKQFRALVHANVEEYQLARSKLDKSMIFSKIVDKVRESGRFVKQRKDKTWYEIGDEQAREKVGHALREALHTQEKPQPLAAISALKTTLRASFTSKQSNLLSTQLSFFEDYVEQTETSTRSCSRDSSEHSEEDDEEILPTVASCSFPW
jgi:hypothetical protein